MNPAREAEDRRLFDRIAAAYGRKDLHPVSRPPRQAMLEIALGPLLREGDTLGTVVDIGCGVGAPARILAGRYDRYLGIDHSEKMVAAARAFNAGNPAASFLAAGVREADPGGIAADLVLSIGALHHMPDLEAVVDRLKRLAKPGGRLVVIEPRRGNPLIWLLRRVRGLVDPAYSREQVFFSVRELRDLFAGRGLTDLEVEPIGFLSTPFAEVIFRPVFLFLPLSRLATAIDAWLTRRLPPWLGWLSFKVAVRARFPENQPAAKPD